MVYLQITRTKLFPLLLCEIYVYKNELCQWTGVDLSAWGASDRLSSSFFWIQEGARGVIAVRPYELK